MPLEVHPAAGEQLAVPPDAMRFAERLYRAVLIEHPPCFFQPDPIQENGELLQQSGILDGVAQASDVGQLWHMAEAGCDAAVDVGLDGVGEHGCRPQFAYQGAVAPDERQVAQRIGAAAVHLDELHLASYGEEKILLLVRVMRSRDDHIIPSIGQCLHHLLAEGIQPSDAVGEDEDGKMITIY